MPLMLLIDKVAVVTGSAKRTGKAIALALARSGADVIIHYNKSRKDADRVVAEIKKLGRNSMAVKADLRNFSEVKAMFRKIVKKFKKIDILVNNVGNFIYKDISKFTSEEWKYQIDTTLNTTFHCCMAVLPYMRKQKFGRIVNMGDSGAHKIESVPPLTAYRIGKTGVLILTKTLAVTEAKHNININMLSPGVIFNTISKPADPPPKGRYASYEDITNGLLFLLDPKSEYITGANLVIGGGWRV